MKLFEFVQVTAEEIEVQIKSEREQRQKVMDGLLGRRITAHVLLGKSCRSLLLASES